MKRILVIIALFLLAVPAANAQMLWKISGRGVEKPSYILGTHHAVPFTYCDSIPGLMKADAPDTCRGGITAETNGFL